MKNIKYLIIAFLTISLFGCEDYLDSKSKSTLDSGVIYSIPTLAEGAVNGILYPLAETNAYRGRFLPYYGLNTDCEWWNVPNISSTATSDLSQYNTKSNNSNMNTAGTPNAWDFMYVAIERANMAIQGLRQTGEATAGTDLGALLGTALTYRAIIYADLVKAWGDIPARFETVSSESIYIPKTDRDQIYKQIIADLKEAEDLVSWPLEHKYTQTVHGINKTFVKAYRARLCLNACGYSQRPDGSVRLSNDPELSPDIMLPVAKQELDEIVAEGARAGKMESSFETVFRKLSGEDYTAGGESLWQLPFGQGRGRIAFHFAPRHFNNDKYFQMGSARGGDIGPVSTLFYDYASGDLRRDVTIVPYQWRNGKQELIRDGDKGDGDFQVASKWYFGKYRFEWMKRVATSTNDDGLQKQYMRFSEIYLMLAEINFKLGNTAEARQNLLKVRARAFDGNEATAASTMNADLWGAIMDENKYEFAGEMFRKEQLIRWNKLGENLKETKERLRELINIGADGEVHPTGRYADVPVDVFYKAANDEDGTLSFYGLNRGETAANAPAGYTQIRWLDANRFSPVKNADETIASFNQIDALFINDPDTKQFWPIWDYIISNSNGTLKNDYGY
ncbi:MAG: RagB/SusD family nutrient uptake outer membrane protein [Prevotellaceae bacterium]|nr:RagB/SusD family nutrient uptake outer membrane protein [Prevotellaceae bacterium]